MSMKRNITPFAKAAISGAALKLLPHMLAAGSLCRFLAMPRAILQTGSP